MLMANDKKVFFLNGQIKVRQKCENHNLCVILTTHLFICLSFVIHITPSSVEVNNLKIIYCDSF